MLPVSSSQPPALQPPGSLPLVLEDQLPSLLEQQEKEVQLLSLEDPTIPKESSYQSKSVFYQEREEWLIAFNALQFWKSLPGALPPTNPDLDKRVSPKLKEWMESSGAIQNLESLTLSNKKMTRIPAEIALCKKLKNLTIMSTPLLYLPPELKQLTELTTLILMKTQVSHLCPELSALEKLEKVELNFNQLKELNPLAPLKRLCHLSASSNKIESLPEDLSWNNLTLLLLDHNEIKRLPEKIYTLTSLTCLNLGNNQIDTVDDKISHFTQIKTLLLDSNRLEQLPLALCQLPKLYSLSIKNNALKTLPKEIGQLPSLTELMASGNPLIEKPPLPSQVWTDLKS